MLLTKMVNEQELIEQFKIGLAISLDKQVLDKCKINLIINKCSFRLNILFGYIFE